MIRLLLADDDALVRAGLRAVLDAEEGLEVAGEAVDGRDAIRRTVELDPDVVLMDIRMPDVSGIEATAQLVARRPDRPAVLVVTTFGNDEHVAAALHAGASGFVLKRSPPAELAAAVRTVHAGVSLVYPRATLELLAAAAPRTPDAALRVRIAQLTEREAEVLGWMTRGASNAEIAAALVLSRRLGQADEDRGDRRHSDSCRPLPHGGAATFSGGGAPTWARKRLPRPPRVDRRVEAVGTEPSGRRDAGRGRHDRRGRQSVLARWSRASVVPRRMNDGVDTS